MGTTESVNLMAGLTFTLLGAVLRAGCKKDTAGQTYFVFEDITTPNDGVTVREMIEDVRALMGKSENDTVPGLSLEDVQSKLDQVKKPDSTYSIDNVRVKLRTVYLKYYIPADGASTVEYALQLDVSAEGLIAESIELVNVDSLTIAVWNTTSPAVLKQMALSIEAV